MTETKQRRHSAKKTPPRVSVIIPAYNHEKYIMETLESVLVQDEQDFEIIVVDDGSTDKTGEILREIEDERIRVVTQANGGTASAVNRGLSLAAGSYVSILNSDDRYRGNRLSTLISELEASPGSLFAMSRVSLIDGDGRPLRSGRDFEWLENAYRYYDETGDLLSAILRDNFTCTSSNFLFRRSLPEEIGPFNDLRYINDLDFLLRAITAGGYVYYDRELLDYRIHAANTMRERERESRADFILEFSWIIAGLLEDKGAHARFDIPRLFDILHDVYPLHLESILFCLSSFRSLERGRGAVIENGEIRDQVRGFIEDNLKREEYLSNLQEASDQASAENRRLFGIIGERDATIVELAEDNKKLFGMVRDRDGMIRDRDGMIRDRDGMIRERDSEIVHLREIADELWRARQWLIGRIEEILASRRYRLASALIDIIKWRNVRYNTKEIVKALLGEGGVQKLRVLRVRTPLKAVRLTLYALREQLRRKLTRPMKHTQAHQDGPLVSVITPCFNYGEYLDRVLTCLEEQTFRNFEIVLIDDGSTDPETIEKIARIEERQTKNLRVIRQENQGVIAARNNAIGEACGKYIFPLDPDDTIDKMFLEKCVLYLESSPPHCFVYTWTYSTGDSDFIWETRASDPVECLNENRIGFVMYSREQFHQAGGYNPVMKEGYEDWEFCVNLVRSGFVGRVIPEPLYNYFVKAQARNWFAIKKHEVLKETINSLHGEYIHKHRKKLRKRARKRSVVVNPLENLIGASTGSDGKAIMIDLRGKTFSPASIFPRILTLADTTERTLIVTLDTRWRPFFDLNGRPNLQVYFPQHYHPEGDVRVTYEYLRGRYRPEYLDVDDIEKMIASSPRLSDGKKNILYIAPWLIVGGADTMTIDWFRNVSGERFNTYFVTTLPKENTWIYKLKGTAREIYDLPSLGCADARDIERFLVDFIGKKRIDIVHIMNSEMAYRALPAVKAAHPGVSVVAQFHCFDYLPDGTRVGYPADVPVKYDGQIDFYNIESENLKKELLELFPYLDPGKFRIIYCCLDTERFLPGDSEGNPDIMRRRDDDRLNILFIGRLDRQKQPLLMARVARELKERGVPFVIHVIGDGSLESQRGELENYRDRHDLSDEIRLYGDQPLESLPDWYRVGDVLLLTSAWEGIPVVLYQAMFMGLVCVAPDVGGVGELVRDETGFLIRDPNDVDAYVSAVVKIAGDAALRERLGGTARELIADRFDMAVMKKGYEELYGGIEG